MNILKVFQIDYTLINEFLDIRFKDFNIKRYHEKLYLNYIKELSILNEEI